MPVNPCHMTPTRKHQNSPNLQTFRRSQNLPLPQQSVPIALPRKKPPKISRGCLMEVKWKKSRQKKQRKRTGKRVTTYTGKTQNTIHSTTLICSIKFWSLCTRCRRHWQTWACMTTCQRVWMCMTETRNRTTSTMDTPTLTRDSLTANLFVWHKEINAWFSRRWYPKNGSNNMCWWRLRQVFLLKNSFWSNGGPRMIPSQGCGGHGMIPPPGFSGHGMIPSPPGFSG